MGEISQGSNRRDQPEKKLERSAAEEVGETAREGKKLERPATKEISQGIN